MLDRVHLRLAQTARHFRRSAPALREWERCLTPEARTAFTNLAPGDQWHACEVANRLRQQNASPELVTAGLLHDIGKSRGGCRVRLVDRAAKVLLERLAPAATERIAAMEDHPRFLDGLWWLCRHAEVGASLVRQWGYPERVAWLIEHHEDCRVDDCELALLIAVDDGRAIEGGARRCEHG